MKRIATTSLIALTSLILTGCAGEEQRTLPPAPTKPGASNALVFDKCPSAAAVAWATKKHYNEGPVHAADGLKTKFPGMDCSYLHREGAAMIFYYKAGTDADAVRADLGTGTPFRLPGDVAAHKSDNGRVVMEIEDRVVLTAFSGETPTAIALANLVLTPSRWAQGPTPKGDG